MKKLTVLGYLMGIIGIAAIIIALIVPFSKTVNEPGNEFAMGMSYKVEDKQTKNTLLTCGIVLMLGGVGSVMASNAQKKN